jgi:hypothetical protein
MEILNEFRCAECGFDNTTMSNADLIAEIAAWSCDDGAVSDVRPSPEVWSPREYAWHMGDVFDFYGERIERVVSEDRPRLDGRDFSVAPQRRDPPDVAGVADRLRALTPEQWRRVGIGSSSVETGESRERDVRNLASRLAHECVHHAHDMEKSR